MNDNKQNTTLLTVIAVATLLVAVVGSTFAYFTAQSTSASTSQVNVTGGKLALAINGTNNWSATSSFEPNINTAFASKTFTVKAEYDVNMNVGFEIWFDYETKFKYPMYAKLSEVDNTANAGKYSLTNTYKDYNYETDKDTCKLKTSGNGTSATAEKGSDRLATGFFKAGNVSGGNLATVTLNFKLELYYPDNGAVQDEDKEATFKGQVRLAATQATTTTTTAA